MNNRFQLFGLGLVYCLSHFSLSFIVVISLFGVHILFFHCVFFFLMQYRFNLWLLVLALNSIHSSIQCQLDSRFQAYRARRYPITLTFFKNNIILAASGPTFRKPFQLPEVSDILNRSERFCLEICMSIIRHYSGPNTPPQFRTTIKLNRVSIGRRHDNDTRCRDVAQWEHGSV